MHWLLLVILVFSFSCKKGKSTDIDDLLERGKLKNGVREGVWIKRDEKGRKISETNYVDGRKEGLSISWYKNGQIYIIAHYKNNQLFGDYIMFYMNGKKNFKQSYNSCGKIHGKFRLWHKNGILSQKGIFENGKMVGSWVKYFPSGEIQDINFYNQRGERDSIWYYFNSDGDTLKVEEYENNNLIHEKIYSK